MPLLSVISYYYGVRPYHGNILAWQFGLWVSSLWFYRDWLTTLLEIGLVIWAGQDLDQRMIAAWPLELWVVGMLVVQPTQWLQALIALSLSLLFGWVTQGFGVGDALVIAALAAHFVLIELLWVMLLACGTTIVHYWLHRAPTYPFVFHLALATQLWLWFGAATSVV